MSDDRPAQKRQSSISKDLRDAFMSMRHRWWRDAAVLAFLFCVLAWIMGLSRSQEEDSLAGLVRSRLGIMNVELVTLGQSWAFFGSSLEGASQRRWAAQWDMRLLDPESLPVELPSLGMLREWAHQSDAYTPEDVERWQERYLLQISHGYYREWSDGSLMVIDLQSNQILGLVSDKWARELAAQ